MRMMNSNVRVVELRFYDPDDGPAFLRVGCSLTEVVLSPELRAAIMGLVVDPEDIRERIHERFVGRLNLPPRDEAPVE